jgi:hypothetical protein
MSIADRKPLESIVEEYGIHAVIMTLSEMCKEKHLRADTNTAKNFYRFTANQLECTANTIADYSNLR